MTTLTYRLRPSIRAVFISFFVHHNPFYLLSALCMLAGCYALNSGLAPRTGDLGKLLGLVGILNTYEFLLIALGLYLIRRRGIVRDGRTLLLLEAPFLVDFAFLNAEVGSVSVRLGFALNLAVLFLAVLKTAMVMHALWGRVPRRFFGFIATELAVLFLLPTAFTRFEHHGDVSGGQFYGAWWAVGLLMTGYVLQSQLFRDPATESDAGLRLFVRRLYVALPLASLILHLSFLHWVYRVAFLRGDLSPVLIGMTFLLGRVGRRATSEILLLRLLLPGAAIVLACESSPMVYFVFGPRVSVTPVSITIAAAYLAYVFCFFLPYAFRLVCGGATLAAVWIFGPSAQQITSIGQWAWDRASDMLNWLSDRTAVQWGLTSVEMAFAFLGLGAGVSLKKERLPEPVLPVLPE